MNVPPTTSARSPLSTGEIAPQSQNRRALANALATINQSGLWPGRALKIHFDMTTRRLTVQIVNSETEEVLDQIPSEEVLRMALELGGNASITYDQGNAKF
jgi:uncharacterized FlaG/YvyC family protein